MSSHVFPNRIFAAGEEPSDERVNSYHRAKRTESVIAALEPEELVFLKNSTFAKVISLDENPPFSGAFGHFILTKKVKDRDMRIKYALLAITSSVLLPSSHFPKIIPEHVELIRDIDQFMAYPWGRVSFQLLMSSLMKKDEIALAQDSFALRGYVDAIQLVMIAAVPALKEEVVPNQPVLLEESESETEESVGDDPERAVETGVGDKPAAPARFVINPKNARDLNAECKVRVRSLLDDPHEEWDKEHDFSWPDEKTDEIVDTLVKLVSDCFKFKNELFLDGLTAADIERLRGGGGIGDLESRIVKAIEVDVAETIRVSGLASKVSALESAISSLQGIEGRMNMIITSSLKAFEETVMKVVSDSYNKMLSNVLGGDDHAYTNGGAADAVRRVIASLDEESAGAEAPKGDLNKSTSSVDPLINTTDHRDLDESDSEELHASDNLVPSEVECPSFSIGLTQDETSDNVVNAQPIEFVLPEELGADIPAEPRKSKRPKTVPTAYTDFQCDPKIVVQHSLLPELETLFTDVQKRVLAMETVNLSAHISVSATEFLDIAFRRQHMPTKVMDALMGYLSAQLKSGDTNVLICDTTFPATLMRMHSRKCSSIHVLDCNVSLKTDNMMKKELNPIANMFPYIAKYSPTDYRNANYKPFSVSRSKGIPQFATPYDSTVMAVFLIDSHSSAGLDGCKAVTQRLLPGAAKQLAVKFFDFISGTD
ncbi:hypothetical protein Bca101_020768 [Brassica carinata]